MTQVEATPAAQSFIARQPIFDVDLDVFAYELLFRSGLENAFNGTDLDHAASKVIADSSLLMDFGNLTSGRSAFVNVTRDVVVRGYTRLLPRESTVIEILETEEPDTELVRACRELRADGYRLALDDFVYSEAWEPLLEIADVIKVDFLQGGPEERRELARRFAGGRVRLLAEKVETQEMVEEARGMGYSCFQGYFFSKPVIISTNDIPSYKVQLLQILREIHRPDLEFSEVERVIKQDMSLCYKLLRYINAARFGLRQPVDSIRRALVLLGQREIKRWATLVALTGVGRDRPAALITQAVVRARFCEALGAAFAMGERADDLFLLGMFSLIDAVLGRPLSELLESLPLADDVKGALLGESNPLRGALDYCIAYERGDWDRLGAGVSLDERKVAAAYVETLQWADESIAAVAAA